MTFIFNCGHALGANPLATIQEEVNRETGGSGGSLWLLSPLVLFPFAILLAVSDGSPMSEWAQKNKGLAYLFVTFAPCIPALLFGMGRVDAYTQERDLAIAQRTMSHEGYISMSFHRCLFCKVARNCL